MKITDIKCHIVVTPNLRSDATSSSQDDFVVFVHTDEGITGVGETDTGPWLAKAAVTAPSSHTMAMAMKELLIGENPFDTRAIWEKLYTYTCMSGRRGAVICAIGAIDTALWDIKGKALNMPVWRLLGGACKDRILIYASLQPYGNSVEEYGESLVDWALKAKEMGYRAMKIECTLAGPYNHSGLVGTDEDMTHIVRRVRETVGSDILLMIDVQYLWWDARSALRTIKDWTDLDLYFLETPLHVENLEGHAKLADQAPMRIASGEWLNTRYECLELMDRGKVDVIQPNVGRVGGLTEAMRVADMAQDRGVLVVPHCWKTGIGIAATAHFAAANPHCSMIEFLPSEMCDSALRRELTIDDDLTVEDGFLLLPQKPGFGVEVDRKALNKYSVDS